MNDHLEGEVLIEGEVAGNCLSMLDRCDECVAEQHVEVREKRDVTVVAPDDVLCRKSVVSTRDGADETGTRLYSLDVGLEVELDPVLVPHAHKCGREWAGDCARMA